jgi:hypothetical protein
MNIRLWLVHLYPRAWRERYGDEFEAFLDDCSLSPLQMLDVITSALDAWIHPVGDGASSGRIANMIYIPHKKELALVVVMVIAAAIVDLNIMALASFARLQGMVAMAASMAVAGVAATLGFVTIAARKIHDARTKQA